MTRYTTHGRSWTRQRELAQGMRQQPPPEEDLLWERLRSRQLDGFKFRRQHPIGRFVVDYCVERGFAIEVDGLIHEQQPDEDRARQEYLEQRGIRFLRFANDAVQQNIERVLSDIRAALAAPAPLLHDVERGLGGEVHAQRQPPRSKPLR